VDQKFRYIQTTMPISTTTGISGMSAVRLILSQTITGVFQADRPLHVPDGRDSGAGLRRNTGGTVCDLFRTARAPQWHPCTLTTASSTAI
jgi:hypothetical protein